MAGRGDNNKHGTSGQGSSNQSNQAFTSDDQNQPKSNHSKRPSGEKASQKQQKGEDQSSNRDYSAGTRKPEGGF